LSAGHRTTSRTPGLGLPLVVAVVAACVPSLVFPGDAPWVNDEPSFIGMALDANARHALATHGLPGTQGVRMGPGAIWIYQAMLLITHDPVRLVLLRAALVSAATAGSLLWLARSLGLWGWFVPAVLISPYVWFYNRLLWDNSFFIPLGTTAMAAYAAFLARPRRWPLVVCLACLLFMPLIHLMAAAMVVPLIAHLVVTQARQLWRWKYAVAGVVVAGCVAALPYAINLRPANPVKIPAPVGVNGWWFPLLGGRVLSAAHLAYFVGPDYFGEAPWLVGCATIVSLAGYVLVWAGIVLAAAWSLAVFRGAAAGPREHVAVVCLLVLLCQVLLDGAFRVFGHPHYYNATWIAYVTFAWFAADRIAGVKLARWAVAGYGAALAYAVLFLLTRIHATGGTRDTHYGIAIGEQLSITEEINRYPQNTTVGSDVPQVVLYPQAMEVLRKLAPAVVSKPARHLFIHYRSSDTKDAHLELLELTPP